MKKLKFLIYAFLCLGIVTAKAQITPVLANLHSFTNGEYPQASLVQSGSTLYGMTPYGGTNGDGIIFSCTTTGTYTVLVNFTGTAGSYAGANPTGSLIQSGSTFYGMTSAGGTDGYGVIFSYTMSGTYTVLYNFPGGTGGATPNGSLLLSGTTLYGMTYSGGVTPEYGTIFSISTSGTGYTDLHNFDGTDGGGPYGSLIISGTTLYGMTSFGGSTFNLPTTDGDGVVFSISTSGTGYTYHSFTGGANGIYPYGDLALVGGTLYGMTEDGGIYSYGNIFSISTSLTGYSDLHDFDGTDGDTPNGSLVPAGSTFYGMTEVGGADAGGNVFSSLQSGTVTDIADFDPYSPTVGLYPLGNVTLSNDVMYGMTNEGGSSNVGNIFSLTACDLNASTSVANVTCNGGTSGTATATAILGVSPFTYSWSPSSQTNATATGLSAGTYTVTITDINGCSATASATITQPSSLGVIAYVNGFIPCFGEDNGMIDAAPHGGTSPYTYSWSPSGETTQQASGLFAGTYTITVTDNCGATATASATLTQPASALSVSASVTTNINCHGASTGSVSSSPSGGTSPYTYSWSPGSGTNSTKTGLTAGTYTITVTDNNGCTATASATVTQPSALGASANVISIIHCYGGTGGISAGGSNGTSPYTYSWSNGGVHTQTQTVTAGTYTATVTDNCGATATASVTITQPTQLAVTIGVGTCSFGFATYTANASGGTTPYTYLWSTGSTTSSIITDGGRSVTVTDVGGCTATASGGVNCPPVAHEPGRDSISGVDNLSQLPDISLYPNPNKGQFTIVGLANGMLVEVYDYTGRLIQNTTASVEAMQFNISNQANGIYLVRIMSLDGILVKQTKVLKVQ